MVQTIVVLLFWQKDPYIDNEQYIMKSNSHNTRNFLQAFFLILLFPLLSACTSTEILLEQEQLDTGAHIAPYDIGTHKRSIHTFDPVNLSLKMNEYQLEQKIDHLFILLDETNMDEEYRGIPTQLYAREILRRLNKSLPEVYLVGKVLVFSEGFGVTVIKSLFEDENKTLSYNRLDTSVAINFNGQFDNIKGGSLAEALDHLNETVTSIPGRSAIVLISRWENIDGAVSESVQRLKQRSKFERGLSITNGNSSLWSGKSGNGTCLYTIGIGNEFSRTQFDRYLACGTSHAADKIAQPRDMAHFVERILFSGPKDSDKDGIFDYQDKCPNTPQNRIVNFDGCIAFTSKTTYSNSIYIGQNGKEEMQ